MRLIMLSTINTLFQYYRIRADIPKLVDETIDKIWDQIDSEYKSPADQDGGILIISKFKEHKNKVYFLSPFKELFVRVHSHVTSDYEMGRYQGLEDYVDFLNVVYLCNPIYIYAYSSNYRATEFSIHILEENDIFYMGIM